MNEDLIADSPEGGSSVTVGKSFSGLSRLVNPIIPVLSALAIHLRFGEEVHQIAQSSESP